ncbi:hypothetical protein [Mycolicibacterium mengxianglii]|uniref:hypothetical protein n=1 Tax=Mycolicibacterium mengxianglii TaxID=2736649 RepID=UPI0018EF150E|nr:hypothetical protein [Mycolicibacterium mengxianglii]
MWDNRRDPEEVALELLASERAREKRNRDSEILAMRLLLAYLEESPDESAYLAWAIQDELGVSREHFEVAVRTARAAARWWNDNGEVEQARTRLLEKLEKLAVPA